MTLAMMDEAGVANTFGGEATQVAVYLANRILHRKNSEKTAYELWKGILTKFDNFKVFRRKFYIKRIEYKLGKLDQELMKAYSLVIHSRGIPYKCYNKRTKKVIECIDIFVDEAFPKSDHSKDVVVDRDFI